jgi:septal ring factor EnvC (AmiA/AmiB activator)
MTAGIEARIKAQEEKLKQLKAQKQQMEARKRAAAAKITRQQDTRRKVLAGAMVLDLMERDEGNRQRFMQRLDSYLTRPDDRALFDLPEKATTAPVAGAGASA